MFTFVRKPTIPFRPPANPHSPMIMVGRRHRDGAVPRLPAGAGRPGTAGRADRGIHPVLRLPKLRRATSCTPMS